MRFSGRSWGALLLPVLFVLSGCNGGSSSGNGSGTVPPSGGTLLEGGSKGVVGHWLIEHEAKELRETGKLESLCPEIRKDPSTTIVNSRMIYEDGGIYLYHPKWPQRRDEIKIGSVNANGELTLTPRFAEQAGVSTGVLTLRGDVLEFGLRHESGGVMKLNYLRSSQEEAVAYFAAQDACKTP